MTDMRIKMSPHPDQFDRHESGIKRVVTAYAKHLPNFGVEIVGPNDTNYDISVAHAGMTGGDVTCAQLHGVYWSEDFPQVSNWQYSANAKIVDALRHAKQVTVPSKWVAETIERDMRFSPHVIPHGIDVDEWEPQKHEGYVLWNKNRNIDVCDPTPVIELARRMKKHTFITTFLPQGFTQRLSNVHVTGVMQHSSMKRYIQRAMVYASFTKETFGIGCLEAMAAGIPVLGIKWGGNIDLIEHGVTGYLARPNDVADLMEGLEFCIEHRDVLGANAREAARAWTWETAVEKVADVYRLAMEEHPYKGECSIVIPCYNYAGSLERAVSSALDQTYPALEIIIVDDGSTDNTRDIGEKLDQEYDKVRYLRKPNGGVATARNHGIEHARGEFISCLDADDKYDPKFLEATVPALIQNRSLGIAYTGIWAISPNGEVLSRWPGECDYDKQLTARSHDNLRGKMNQVPTCCVFRREAWVRTGGFRQRYAPLGAGAEDAELWAHIMSIGYGAKKTTDAGLFIYSHRTGRVSGAQKGDVSYDLIEPFWLAMKPWAVDGRHPFASRATPLNNRPSHPVRQYDEPMVSVIIPVGPGHEEIVKNALDSLEAQTFRQWEVIVVWDAGGQYGVKVESEHGVGVELHMPKESEKLLRSYPYIHMYHTGPPGQGAGKARNQGAKAARAPFIVFLDADDTLAPTFIEECLLAWQQEQSIVYTDYYNSTITTKADLVNFKQDDIQQFIERTGELIVRGRSADFDCARAQNMATTKKDLYHWSLVTAFIPKAWHDAIGGFDETMESFEDVLYHWELARAGYCYARIAKPLVSYRMHTGTRREKASFYTEQGRIVAGNMLEYAQKKLQETKQVACKTGCGGAKVQQQPVQIFSGNQVNQISAEATQRLMSNDIDDNYVLCTYMSLNRGNHNVVGRGQTLDGNKRHIGYIGGGKQCLVHKLDIAAQPLLFQPVQESVQSAPQPEVAPLPEPELAPEATIEQFGTNPIDVPSLRDVEISAPVDITALGSVLDIANNAIDKPEPEPRTVAGMDDDTIDLQEIPGISPIAGAKLTSAGFNTKARLLEFTSQNLASFINTDIAKAEMILNFLRREEQNEAKSQTTKDVQEDNSSI